MTVSDGTPHSPETSPSPSILHRLTPWFGRRSPIARQGIASLYRQLNRKKTRSAESALDRWTRLLWESTGRTPDSLSEILPPLVKTYRVTQRDDPELPATPAPLELLFALHTYMALVTKVFTWSLIGKNDLPLPGFRTELLKRLEAGEPTRIGRSSRGFWPQVDALFAWYLDAMDDQVRAFVEHLFEAAVQATGTLHGQSGRCSVHAWRAVDWFGPLYQDLFPRKVRHQLGEYYTPPWLADLLLDQLEEAFPDTSRSRDLRVLDPACGSGIFLLRTLRRLSFDGTDGLPDQLPFGFDLNPLAVLMARANYALAIRCSPLARSLDDFSPESKVHLFDTIVGEFAETKSPDAGPPIPDMTFDRIVGNPPWVAWDHLPPSYREKTHHLWRRLGLFSLSGNEARHGGGKKDLSMLMVYTCADRYLRDRGHLGMILPQSLLQTRKAGSGFRRFHLAESEVPLGVGRVQDLSRIKPFDGATTRTATLVLQKGEPTNYPIPYDVWLPENGKAEDRKSVGDFIHEASEPVPAARAVRCVARPISHREAGAPWFVSPDSLERPVEELFGPSDYRAMLGANTGGANGVFWLRIEEELPGDLVRVRNLPGRGKQPIASIEWILEKELVYPLVRWGDVAPFRATPSAALLLAQDPLQRKGQPLEVMQRRFPRTLGYLEQYRELLQARAAYRKYQQRGPFYAMYNIGPETVAPIKVVWRRMDSRIRAAVLPSFEYPRLGTRCVIPQETCCLIAVETLEEGDYLAAVLNSSVTRFLTSSWNVEGGKGFGSPGMLDFLRLERYNTGKREHRRLADLGRILREANPPEEALWEIDRLVGGLRSLDPETVRKLSLLTENPAVPPR
jgi:SAM-dependent methyltransferase